jgi:hypothetical protein
MPYSLAYWRESAAAVVGQWRIDTWNEPTPLLDAEVSDTPAARIFDAALENDDAAEWLLDARGAEDVDVPAHDESWPLDAAWSKSFDFLNAVSRRRL